MAGQVNSAAGSKGIDDAGVQINRSESCGTLTHKRAKSSLFVHPGRRSLKQILRTRRTFLYPGSMRAGVTLPALRTAPGKHWQSSSRRIRLFREIGSGVQLSALVLLIIMDRPDRRFATCELESFRRCSITFCTNSFWLLALAAEPEAEDRLEFRLFLCSV